jgi:sugar/nucleoside kinase (ribokinase family)
MFPESAEALTAVLDKIQAREILYDFNLRGQFYSRKIFESSLHFATIARCNQEECQILSTILFGKNMSPENFAHAVSKTYFVPVVCVRLNNGGAVVCHAGKTESIPAAASVEPKGAGPVFNAAFLTSILNGDSPAISIRTAIDAAANAAARRPSA